MASPIKFGTDGWRAVIADDFTFDNVRACAQGVAGYLKEAGKGKSGVVIGYDTRYASEDFAAASAEVLASNGIKVYLSPKPVPTPVTSYTVTALKADGAIMITASHNPANYNGFKYKVSSGSSAGSDIISIIEKNANDVIAVGGVKGMELKEAVKKRLITFHDPVNAYAKQLGKMLDIEAIKQQPIKIIVDPMFGAGIGFFRKLLEGGQLEVHEINKVRNPLFPGTRPEPIGINLSKLSRNIIKERAAVGFATDGDADRIGIIDENGRYMNTQEVFALLALYLLEIRKQRGALVKTLTSTDMLYKIGELYNVPVIETPVGFKYVAPIMIKENALLGGEESGGYGFRGHIPERDGLLAGLYFLDYMLKTKKSPAQLLADLYSKVGPHYYDRLDIHAEEPVKKQMLQKLGTIKLDRICNLKVIKLDTRDGFRYKLSDGSWLLIRFSGTEPLVRIYAESGSNEQVQKLIQYGQELLGA